MTAFIRIKFVIPSQCVMHRQIATNSLCILRSVSTGRILYIDFVHMNANCWTNRWRLQEMHATMKSMRGNWMQCSELGCGFVVSFKYHSVRYNSWIYLRPQIARILIEKCPFNSYGIRIDSKILLGHSMRKQKRASVRQRTLCLKWSEWREGGGGRKSSWNSQIECTPAMLHSNAIIWKLDHFC